MDLNKPEASSKKLEEIGSKFLNSIQTNKKDHRLSLNQMYKIKIIDFSKEIFILHGKQKLKLDKRKKIN